MGGGGGTNIPLPPPQSKKGGGAHAPLCVCVCVCVCKLYPELSIFHVTLLDALTVWRQFNLWAIHLLILNLTFFISVWSANLTHSIQRLALIDVIPRMGHLGARLVCLFLIIMATWWRRSRWRWWSVMRTAMFTVSKRSTLRL